MLVFDIQGGIYDDAGADFLGARSARIRSRIGHHPAHFAVAELHIHSRVQVSAVFRFYSAVYKKYFAAVCFFFNNIIQYFTMFFNHLVKHKGIFI